MPQSFSDRLCINEIAKLWKGESNTPLSADDIASVLLDAALNGEFQFRPEGAIRGEDGTLPRNFDVRLRLLIETSRRTGAPVTAHGWQKYIDPLSTARWTPGGPLSSSGSAQADTEARRQGLTREIFISMRGLSRWCDQPAFEKWVNRRKLGRPNFMDDARDQTTKNADHSELAQTETTSLMPNTERGRREEGKRKTRVKYQRWYDCAQEIRSEGKWTRPTEIAAVIAKREKDSKETGVNAKNIRRRLDQYHPGWAK